MNAIFKGAAGFVIGYLFFMLPTYVLPYFGSNSAIVGAIGAAVGRGFTPQFWLHAWSLSMLVLVTSIRGKNIGKGWLLIFPVLAGFFDLVPLLNLIPLVPTVMHLLALVLGAMGSAAVISDTANLSSPDKKDFSWEPWAAGLISLSAISGTFHFMAGMKAMDRQVQTPSAASVSPNPGPSKAQAATIAPSQSTLPTSESSLPAQAAASTTSGNQTSKPIPPKPQAKKPPSFNEVSRAPESKKTEEKPTVRYIDINK